MRYYLVDVNGTVHADADKKEYVEAAKDIVEKEYTKEYGRKYVEELELEIIEGK